MKCKICGDGEASKSLQICKECIIEGKGEEFINIKEDPSDDKFIHCARDGKAPYIITGDHHLLDLKSVGKIRILTPSRFLENF